MSGSFRPFGDLHAIQTVVFVVEFNAHLDQPTFREIALLHSKFKSELPRKQEQKSVVVNIAPTSPDVPIRSASPEIGGVVFDRLAPDGQQEWALSVQPNLASVSCTKYEGWVTAWHRAESYLRIVLPIVYKRRTVVAIGLQYTDKFIWEGAKSELNISGLFRKESPYLVPNAYTMGGPWHSHHGYFISKDQPNRHKLLNNINIDLLEEDGVRVVRITTTHRSTPESPIKAHISAVEAEQSENTIDAYMHVMHKENKAILGKLLNEEMCSRIKLNP